MLPDYALIVVPNVDDADILFDFLDNNGVCWNYRDEPLMPHLEYTKNRYRRERDKVLTYELHNGLLEYCYESWYRHNPSHENKEDDRFNYCNVQEFLELCGETAMPPQLAILNLL